MYPRLGLTDTLSGPGRRLLAACCAAVAMFGASPGARAAPITYAFTGIFDVSNAASNVYTDKPFAGSFTYDPAVAPRPQAQLGAADYDALIAFDLRILDVQSPFGVSVGLAAGPPTGTITIEEETNGANSDAFVLRPSEGPRKVVSSDDGRWGFYALQFRLEQRAGSLFDDARSLPPTLDLSDFDYTLVDLRLVATSGSAVFDVLGRLLTLEQVDNPPLEVGEPGSLALVSIAAGALAVAGRRGRHRSGRPIACQS
jgi:hypothetical protein